MLKSLDMRNALAINAILHFMIDILHVQGVPYAMARFRKAVISFVLMLLSRYIHIMFHTFGVSHNTLRLTIVIYIRLI